MKKELLIIKTVAVGEIQHVDVTIFFPDILWTFKITQIDFAVVIDQLGLHSQGIHRALSPVATLAYPVIFHLDKEFTE